MLLKGTLLCKMPAYYASIICWHILLIRCWVATCEIFWYTKELYLFTENVGSFHNNAQQLYQMYQMYRMPNDKLSTFCIKYFIGMQKKQSRVATPCMGNDGSFFEYWLILCIKHILFYLYYIYFFPCAWEMTAVSPESDR